MIINHITEENKGYFQAMEDGIEAGRMTYVWAGEHKFIIDHTEVNPDFGGRGVGKQLLMQAVDFARERGVKILPLCPFAKSVFEKDASIEDVLF